MMTQLYQLVGQFDDAEPAQFVFESDKSEMICGFLTENTTTTSVEVCLFAPVSDATLAFDHVRLLASIGWEDELVKALRANPAMHSRWVTLLNQASWENSLTDSGQHR